MGNGVQASFVQAVAVWEEKVEERLRASRCWSSIHRAHLTALNLSASMRRVLTQHRMQIQNAALWKELEKLTKTRPTKFAHVKSRLSGEWFTWCIKKKEVFQLSRFPC